MWAASRNWYKLVVDVCILRVRQGVFSENFFAHRVCSNLSIFVKKLHRLPEFLFLTDRKKIKIRKSCDVFTLLLRVPLIQYIRILLYSIQ